MRSPIQLRQADEGHFALFVGSKDNLDNNVTSSSSI
jgi:hypothetical protein